MELNAAYLNSYGYAIDRSNIDETVNKILANAAQKADVPEPVLEQNLQNSNAALLFEYTQNIAKSNIAQQLVLDNNLKETLKFLKSEAAKKLSISPKKKHDALVQHILAENDINDFESEEQAREEDDLDNFDDLDLFNIKIDSSKGNIFAA